MFSFILKTWTTQYTDLVLFMDKPVIHQYRAQLQFKSVIKGNKVLAHAWKLDCGELDS